MTQILRSTHQEARNNCKSIEILNDHSQFIHHKSIQHT